MESWSSIIQAGAAIATAFLTLFIVLYAKRTIDYAKATIEEGKKNRRKDSIERMLESLYSPFYEILRKAKFDPRRYKWKDNADEYLVFDSEYKEIYDRLAIYGHYLSTEDLQKLKGVGEGSTQAPP